MASHGSSLNSEGSGVCLGMTLWFSELRKSAGDFTTDLETIKTHLETDQQCSNVTVTPAVRSVTGFDPLEEVLLDESIREKTNNGMPKELAEVCAYKELVAQDLGTEIEQHGFTVSFTAPSGNAKIQLYPDQYDGNIGV